VKQRFLAKKRELLRDRPTRRRLRKTDDFRERRGARANAPAAHDAALSHGSAIAAHRAFPVVYAASGRITSAVLGAIVRAAVTIMICRANSPSRLR
jgi:hypothetical protein